MDAGRVIADGAPRHGDDGPGGDRRLSRRRRGMTLLCGRAPRRAPRPAAGRARRQLRRSTRARRRPRRRQRRRQDDAAARDRRRAPSRRRARRVRRRRRHAAPRPRARRARASRWCPKAAACSPRMTVEENLLLARSAGRAGPLDARSGDGGLSQSQARAGAPAGTSVGRRAAGDGDRPRADDQPASSCCSTKFRSACRRSRSSASTRSSRR